MREEGTLAEINIKSKGAFCPEPMSEGLVYVN